MASFDKCDRTKRFCKSEAEIEAWMEFKYIFTFENQKKFSSYKFGEEAMAANAYGNWHSLSYGQRSEFVSEIKRSKTVLNDSPFGVG